MTTTTQQNAVSRSLRPAPLPVDARCRGASRLRSPALGGHRPASPGDDLPLLLHGDPVDPAAGRGGAGSRGAIRAAHRVGARQLRRCSHPRGRRTGLPDLHAQQCDRRPQHRGPHLARGIAGRVRGESAGVLRPAPGQWPVPGRLPVPEHPACRPLFVFFTRIGLRGTLVGLLIVYVSQIVAVSIYMLRNYFDTIPVSLEEAAAIDGCSRLGIMRRISLPLAMPAIMSNALFVFMIAWNEFLFALLFLVRNATGGRSRWGCPSWPAASRSPRPS